MTTVGTLIDIAATAIAGMPLRQFVEDVSLRVNYLFIDENFHYPQLKTILSGDYTSWDSKITTPPGLYYLTALYAKLSNVQVNLANMRMFNYLGGLFLATLLISIRRNMKNPGFASASIYLNPIIAIFYSLYYTDVWASAVVIAAYAIILQRPVGFKFTAWLSAMIGLLSVTFRQTNIAWCVFLLTTLIDAKCKVDGIYKYENEIDDFVTFIKTALKNFDIILPYAITGGLFVGFSVLNGGVALGDKENHVLVPHLAQLCYCATFIVALTVPQWFSLSILFEYVGDNFLTIKGLLFNATWIPILSMMVYNFTIVHPFVLADNRHYTFYIVHRFITRTENSRMQLVPIYHFSCYVIYKMFKQNEVKHLTSKVVYHAFLACTLISVCLSPLFEPRYYILPVIFYRLLTSTSDRPFLGLPLLRKYNVGIRLVLEVFWSWFWTQAIYIIFLQFTFEWDDLPDLQRIIW